MQLSFLVVHPLTDSSGPSVVPYIMQVQPLIYNLLLQAGYMLSDEESKPLRGSSGDP